MMKRLLHWITRLRMQRLAYRQLQQLDDRMLRDIGLRRDQI